MQHAPQARSEIAKNTANPRELEADILLTAAARLQAIRDGWDSKRSELEAALLYNRKLWSIFVTSATSTENPLPAGLRQNVANIGLFVFKQTLTTLIDPKPENLGSLININRELAAGLLGRA
jgi:flagellar protein FlaF